MDIHTSTHIHTYVKMHIHTHIKIPLSKHIHINMHYALTNLYADMHIQQTQLYLFVYYICTHAYTFLCPIWAHRSPRQPGPTLIHAGPSIQCHLGCPGVPQSTSNGLRYNMDHRNGPPAPHIRAHMTHARPPLAAPTWARLDPSGPI